MLTLIKQIKEKLNKHLNSKNKCVEKETQTYPIVDSKMKPNCTIYLELVK